MRANLLFVFLQITFCCQGQINCDNFEYLGRTGKLKITEDMKVIPFKDNSNLMGLKKRSNDSILIQAKFKKICENFNDTLFIVSENNNSEGAINIKGEIVAPFSKGLYQFNVADTSINFGGILYAPVCINNTTFNGNSFFVDRNGDCVAYDYYPCPDGVKIANNNKLTESQYYIQKAIECKYRDPNVAIVYFNQAINIDTVCSSTYFSCVRMFMDRNELNITSQKSSYYERFHPIIEYCIQKGIEYERNPHYLLKFNKYKSDFYKSCVIDKIKVKEAEIEVQRLTDLIENEKYSNWW